MSEEDQERCGWGVIFGFGVLLAFLISAIVSAISGNDSLAFLVLLIIAIPCLALFVLDEILADRDRQKRGIYYP